MALFFLSYDLRNDRDYETLYDELDKFNAVRVLESCYCFERIKTSAKNLRDHFAGFIDSDDGLIVTEVSDWASRNAIKTPNDL